MDNEAPDPREPNRQRFRCFGRRNGGNATLCALRVMSLHQEASYALANDHNMLKGESFSVTRDTNAVCQRMANEVHKDVLPGDSHVTAMEALKDEFGVRTSATTTPGVLKIMFVTIACRKIRMQRRLLGLGTAHEQQPKPRAR